MARVKLNEKKKELGTRGSQGKKTSPRNWRTLRESKRTSIRPFKWKKAKDRMEKRTEQTGEDLTEGGGLGFHRLPYMAGKKSFPLLGGKMRHLAKGAVGGEEIKIGSM